MDALLDQLGQLLQQALPTFILLILLHIYLKWIFYGPLDKVLRERHSATEGARQAAAASIRKADEKAAEHEEALRAARAELYQEQDAARKRLAENQSAELAKVREEVDGMLAAAKVQIAQEVALAKQGLEAETEALARDIVESILERKAS